MANQEQVERFKHSVQEWDQWRHNHPDIKLDLSSADFNGANLLGADLSHATLSSADLRSANLNSADLIRANLIRANLNSATLNSANLNFANLSYANLSHAHLNPAFLEHANLHGADLFEADLSGANLYSTNLSGATLRSADLRSANLSHADLSSADLNGADLICANLSGAKFRGTNLSETKLSFTIFGGEVDLRSVKGLVEINHAYPSIVQLHGIQLPQDGSALHFLRGVSVPDEWIDLYRATMMHPIQYYSCFLSYSSTDEHIAKRLHADPQANDVGCWFAPHDLKPGNYVRKEIDQAIHMQDKLLLILSENSVNSGWVDYEVELALAREIRQKREILFPIRLDNEVLQSTSHWATTLRNTRQIGDFTNWTDPQTYQQIFDHLLRDLKKANV
ncbi:MAG: toll/interleukin-1 receptor domain-containing protein [Ktedonobacteraceae bacterium]